MMHNCFSPSCRIIPFEKLMRRAKTLAQRGDLKQSADLLILLARTLAYPDRPEIVTLYVNPNTVR